MRRLLPLQIFMLMMMPSLAFGWGETGHRVVCQIAYEELQPVARAELDRLLAQDPDFESFAESCLFADKPEVIRPIDHYVNYPRSATAVTTGECPLADSCVVTAIADDIAVLKNSGSSDAEKLLAMKLLGHWVGDVHQPLHASFMDDRGANSINVDRKEMEWPNFHGIWDGEILSYNLGDDYLQIATQLRGAISNTQREAWKNDSPIEWVNESFQITIAPATKYCVRRQNACWYADDNMLLSGDEPWRNTKISDRYLRKHGDVVRLRLQKAGVRLAQQLNQSLIVQE
ncbi:MAG: S1/P1 nuclease [Woeseiaceae bacterium]